MALQKALGVSKLKGKEGEVDVSTIEGKTLLIYFSAHWCPPCRQFTPVLAKFYREQKEKRSDFEIVFASSDKDESQFNEYYKEHPWLALPFAERKAKEKLSRKYKVQGIPTLVVLDKSGELVTNAGRERVMSDSKGEKFPWIPRKVFEVLAETQITNKEGKQLTVDDLKKLDAVALYFSAHWCPPCRAFTPRLVSTYNKLREKHTKTEFIFVSSDRDQSQFEEYYGEMPWARLPFQDSHVKELKELCDVEGIPTLVTVKGDGTIINKDARGGAAEDADGSNFPWAPVQLGPCSPFTPNDSVVEALNSDICVILNANGATNKETAKIEFTKAAEQFHKDPANSGDDSAVRFFICDGGEGEDLFERVAQVVSVSKPAPGHALVLAINLPNNRAKDSLGKEISAQNVMDFVAQFKKAQNTD